MAKQRSEAQRRADKKYQAKPESKKRRAGNTRARRLAQREGWDKPGDGMDVAHKDDNFRNSKRSNLAHQKPSKNRSYDRTANGHRAKKKKKK